MAMQGGNDDRPSSNNLGNNQQVTVGELRKGPWTPEEDAILQDYVTKNGEGNWNVLQQLSGLKRCNKSCRLRWLNHLRPNLKKGAIIAEEEAVIVQLHQKFGNKWAYIAKQLPGRTDNEIKNFWHTRRKKRQKANLPLHPTQSDKEEINNYIQPVSNISINPSSSSLPSSCMTTFVQPPIYEKLRSMSYSPNNNADQIYPMYPHNNNNKNYSVFPENNNNNDAGFIGQLNTGFINNLNSFTTFNLDSNPNPPLLGPKTYEHNSLQVVHTTQPNVDIFNRHSNANEGLLEDIINQEKTLNHKSKKNNESNQIHDHELLWDYKIDNKGPISLHDLSLYGGQNFIQTNNFHESSSSFSALGSMETNTVNYYFFNSLDNSPFTGGPMPDWYERSFNGVQQTTMPNMQELFNPSNSMAMEVNSVLQTTLPENRQELINPSNSMEMATSQPFMDNSGNWNIIPGSVHQAFNDNGNNDSISNINQ